MAAAALNETGTGAGSRVGRVFFNRPERVAAAWRRLRCAQLPPGEMPHNLLEDVVEPFIRELGAALEGQAGSPWGRTRGVLRLSHSRGSRALFEEFATLRRCLLVSLEVLEASEAERALVERALEEATDGAVALQESLTDPAGGPPLPFGGVVLEMFDGQVLAATVAPEKNAPPVH